MKLTKRTLVAFSSLTIIALVGVRLSLRTMEGTGQASEEETVYINPLEQIAAEEFIKTNTSVTEIKKLEILDRRSTWISDRLYSYSLIKKLTSPQTLDEFRDHGTVDGEELKDVVSNEWAINVFKPAMANIATPFVLTQTFTKQREDRDLTPIAFSYNRDNSWFASGSEDGTINIKTLQPNNSWGNTQILTGNGERIFALAFSPDGKQLASTFFNKTMRIWTLQPDNTWKNIQTLTYHHGPVAFSADGRYLASSSENNTISILTRQPDNTWEMTQTISGHTGDIFSLAFNPYSRQLASGSLDGTVRVLLF